MALAIRLRRIGRKNRPHYRVVVAEKRSPRDGRFVEEVGNYDPVKKEDGFSLDMERIQYWLARGAKPSETVNSFIKKQKKAA
jgi:small subunit ribosomal protein S16